MQGNSTEAEAQTSKTPDPAETYDVAVLGGHLAAGLLSAVLARQGVRVLMLGTADDDAELSGETTVPYTAEVFLLLAKRFEVPEIAAFGLFSDLPQEIRATSGVKASLGFLYHRPGQSQAPAESMQFNVPGEHAEWHLYRPDVDRYARELAGTYGAVVGPQDVRVEDAFVEGDEAQVRGSDGNTYRARYVVDCLGPNSPLTRRHGGDDQEPRLRNRSLVYGAHLRDVPAFEDLRPLTDYRKATPWSHGTVHHLFEGGWIQLVSYGNHPESASRITSVTFGLDPERFDDLPEEPEKVFQSVIERYPDLSRQFEGATVERAWRGAADFQRTAVQATGTRWFALERSAARNDMFLSRDVTMGMECVHALASALIPAVQQDDWSNEPFERIAQFQETLGEYNDSLLRAAQTATRDFRLWNAFSRVWLLWQILADLSLKRARLDCEAGAERDWSPVERFELGGIWFRAPEGLREIVTRTMDTIEEVRAGKLEAAAASERIFADLRQQAFVPPLYSFGKPEARVYHFSFPKRLQMLLWSKTKAPADFRRLLTRDNVTSVTSESSR